MNLRNNHSQIPLKRSTDNLTQDLGGMFERFAREFFSPQLDDQDFGFKPSVEVEETDTGYRVSAELPGMKEKDIILSLKDNSLVIEGKKETRNKAERKGFYHSEFSYGAFYRTIPLRADVDDNNIKATFEDGILIIDLVKRADGIEKTKRIPINRQ